MNESMESKAANVGATLGKVEDTTTAANQSLVEVLAHEIEIHEQ